jgi:hypothetical protein
VLNTTGKAKHINSGLKECGHFPTCAHGNAEAAANWVEATLPVAPLVHILVHVRVAASMEPAAVAQKAADEGEEDGEQNGHDQAHDEQRVINPGFENLLSIKCRRGICQLEWEAARVVDGRGVALGPARLMVRRIPVNQRLDHILVVSLATVVALEGRRQHDWQVQSADGYDQ